MLVCVCVCAYRDDNILCYADIYDTLGMYYMCECIICPYAQHSHTHTMGFFCKHMCAAHILKLCACVQQSCVDLMYPCRRRRRRPPTSVVVITAPSADRLADHRHIHIIHFEYTLFLCSRYVHTRAHSHTHTHRYKIHRCESML